jgi:hypothetical protein
VVYSRVYKTEDPSFVQFVETPEFNPEAERYRIAAPDFDAYQNQDPTRRHVRSSEVVL